MSRVEVIETLDFTREAAFWISARILAVQGEGGTFILSLCGGGTPGPVYERLARAAGIDWGRVVVTFGDERTVPPDHADSNYRMAKATFLDPAGIPDGNVVRIEGELPPSEAARRCEAHLRDRAANRGEVIFRHDLVLLGMGDDGHTASLFPGSAALKENHRWVVENYVASLDSWRITVTYPLIAAAREVAFLVCGEKKRTLFEKIRAGEGDYPAAAALAGEVTWLLGK